MTHEIILQPNHSLYARSFYRLPWHATARVVLNRNGTCITRVLAFSLVKNDAERGNGYTGRNVQCARPVRSTFYARFGKILSDAGFIAASRAVPASATPFPGKT